jgi:HEAT repeat protein
MTMKKLIAAFGQAFGLCVLVVMVASTTTAAAGPGPTSTEAELVAVLRSDAPEADKAIACKFLAVKGSPAAVAELAPLLANPRLASWARIPLEAIPGPEASAVLREAASKLEGRLLCGVLTSLGARRDEAAVPLLAEKLASQDAEVTACAAWSLGQIATPEAAAILAGAIAKARDQAQMDAVAKAAVLCGENLVAAGRVEDALALYGTVLSESSNEQRHAEATRGMIIAKGRDGIPLLGETLRSPTKRMANMAIFTARDLGRGEPANASLAAAVDVAVLGEIQKAAADGAVARAAVLIDVIAERNAGNASPTVTDALAALAAIAGPTNAKPLRLAAIEALGRTGSATVIGPLLVAAADDDSGIADTARAAVAALEGDAVNKEIAKRLAGADGKVLPALPALLELVGRRRIDAVEAVLPLVNHGDAKVRTAALVALGPTVDLANLDVLIVAAIAPKHETEGTVAKAALQEASVRMADRDACVSKLVAALEKAPAEMKVMLLDTIGGVGGAKAVATMATAAKSGEESLEDAATRLLGKWMTADAAPVLLELATAEPGGKFKTRALKGYIRIARQFVLPDAERAAMCRKALAAATAEADRKAVLEILERYPSTATLAVAEEAEKVPGLEGDAKKVASAIRGKLAPSKKGR